MAIKGTSVCSLSPAKLGVHVWVDSERGLIHSAETTSANVLDLNPAALLHGEENVVHADAGCEGIAKRSEMQGRGSVSALRCGQSSAGPYRIHQRDVFMI